MPSLCPIPSEAELRQKNREVYDRTSDPIWRLVAYDPLHDGWEFLNLGGHWLLERIGRQAGLGRRSSVLELCCGQGAACRYLAERYECAVTGVDVNAAQIRTARARLETCSPASASRMTFVETDVADWAPPARYDVVFSLDALMLIPDPRQFLAKARAALAPGGFLAVSTLGAGVRLDDAMRRFVWEVDGMVTLPALDELADVLRGDGYAETRVEDLTPIAIAASITMNEATERARDAIVSAYGEAAYRGWRDTGIVYRRAFETGALSYLLATGIRGAQAPVSSKQGEDLARDAGIR